MKKISAILVFLSVFIFFSQLTPILAQGNAAASTTTNQNIFQKIGSFISSIFNGSSNSTPPKTNQNSQDNTNALSILSQKVQSLEISLNQLIKNQANTSTTPAQTSPSGLVVIGSTLNGNTIIDSLGDVYPSNSALTSNSKPSLGIAQNPYYGLYLNHFTVPAGGLTGGPIKSDSTGTLTTSAINVSGSDITGVVGIGNGGTGVSTAPINGQLLIGNTTNSNFSLAGLSAGSGITITNGAGTITISASGGSTSNTSLTLTNTTNQITLGATNTTTISSAAPSTSRTYTIPDFGSNDTFVGLAATQTLTNKTLTAPIIQGTVGAGTGLTFPAYTASGNITGSGSPTISSFGAINGLTLTSNSTGFSVAGGTTSKTLTLNNTLTLAGTDSTTMTFPAASDTVAGLGTTQTFTKPNTFSLGANAGVALTATSTTNATPNDALDINLANTSGTATNGLLVNQTGAGTVTNGVNITQGASGVITNALRFIGTFTNLINSTNYSVLNSGAVSSAADTITSSSANALAVGANGSTNPAFNIDASTASSVTGLNVKSAASGGGLALSAISSAAGENLTIDAKGTGTITLAGTSTGTIALARNTTVTGTITGTSSGASALAVGANGSSNPALQVDASTASSATGLSIKSAAAAGGIALSAISSGAAENLTLDAKGTGTVTLNGTGTGNISLARNTSVTGTLTGTSSNAAALAVGQSGATNPALNVDASTASSVTGLNVKSAASGAGLALSVISSAAAENLTVDAKSTGTVSINSTGTGNITLGRATTITTGGLTVTAGGLTVSAGNVSLTTTATNGTTTFAGSGANNVDHLVSTQTTLPTETVVTYTAGTVAAGSTDTKGQFTVTTTAATGSVSLVFTGTYASAPICTVTPASANTQADASKVYVTSLVGSMTVNYNVAPAANLQTWNYYCIQ